MGKKGKRGKRGKAVDSDDETEGQIPAQVQVDESDNESEEADGKILSDDPGPFFSEGLELIQERRAESHMKGLNILRSTLARLSCSEAVDDAREELFMCLLNSVKRGKEKESTEASEVLSMCVLALGPEEEALFSQISPVLEEVALKGKKPGIRAAALRALTFACFISTMEHSHTWHVFDLLYGIIATAGTKLKMVGDEQILEAACDSFGLLASTIQRSYFAGSNFEKTISRLGPLLTHGTPAVRTAAGQTLAMVFEINQSLEHGSTSRKPSGDRHRGFSVHSQADESDETDEARAELLAELSNVMSEEEVIEAVETLAGEYDRSKGKQERKEQRSVFRDIVSTISRGEAPETTLTIRNEDLTFDSWAHILQLNSIRRVLGGGFQFHFRNNRLVRSIFGLGEAPVEDGDDRLSKLEKRLFLSENSAAKKEKSKERNKDRRNKHNAKNQFMTCD